MEDDTSMELTLNKYKGSRNNINIHLNTYHTNIRQFQHPQNNL